MPDVEKYAMYRAGKNCKNAGEVWLVPQEDEDLARKMTKKLLVNGYELVGMIATELQPEEIRTGFAYTVEMELRKANDMLNNIKDLIANWR